MKALKYLKYVNLVEIGPIVFELGEGEIGYYTSRINNTLACQRIFLGMCLDQVNN